MLFLQNRNRVSLPKKYLEHIDINIKNQSSNNNNNKNLMITLHLDSFSSIWKRYSWE